MRYFYTYVLNIKHTKSADTARRYTSIPIKIIAKYHFSTAMALTAAAMEHNFVVLNELLPSVSSVTGRTAAGGCMLAYKSSVK